MGDRPRVVLVGFGFAGLNAAKRLARTEVDVLIVDRRNYFLFTPLLYQVASAGLERDSITFPIRALFRRAANIDYLMGSVGAIDVEGKKVRVDDAWISYDYLIAATGSVTNYFGNDALETATLPMKELNEAEVVRNAVLTNFEAASREADAERRRALMTVVVVGGGPTGVEMAGALIELIRHPLEKDFPRVPIDQAQVILVEATGTILSTYLPKMQERALARLKKMGVGVELGRAVASVTGDRVTLGDGTVIRAAAVVWAAGVRAAPPGSALGAASRAARIPVTPALHLQDHPEIYVVGDLALCPEDAYPNGHPMVAPVATQQGDVAARNVLSAVRGRPQRPFRYHDSGQVATIGRRAAVAELRHLRLSGFPAWVTWLAIHLIRLIGFRNKLVVLLNWAYNYLTYDRGVRMIVEPVPPPPPAEGSDASPKS
ncbi:MAG TPA: NAD(P)/FAD-dependent oxidoreductase [Actinomycetota bacterium]|nr:NAD(P)/FAD-dependent oxidoreductase [Actinomycetota bacterium]